MQFILLALLAAAGVAAEDGVCPPKWGYEESNGPDRWGQLEEAWKACDGGVQQSPVALQTAGSATTLPELTLQYADGPLVVQHTGVELKVPTVRGTLNYGTGVVNAPLTQLHFHVRSEHTVDGSSHAAEMHLVHQLGDRTYVVAVFIEDTAQLPNVALQQILDLKPAASCSSRRRPENFDLQTLLPPASRFWTYQGSLTTPACAEGVTFFVLRSTIKGTKEQAAALRVERDNARPVQGLGARTVRKNF